MAGVTVLLSACDAQPSPMLAAEPDTLVVSEDPALQRMAAELLPDLADRAGLELREPVRVEWRSRAELEGYLRLKVDEELPAAEADRLVRSYALLGLVPSGLDLRGVLMDLYLEQVAGFYDPDSTALWVLDDQAEQDVQTVLLHELVHAVQDQEASLDSITAPHLGSDRRTAAQAAIEGHATLVMLEAMLEQGTGQAIDLSELTDFAATLGPILESARSQYPSLAAAPRILQESLLFPYLAGAGFVLETWSSSDGRPAPFGSMLPTSTEQILHPERFVGAERDDPVRLQLQLDDGTAEFEDELGELGLRVFALEQLADSAGVLARGWDGDAFVLHASASGDGLTWAIAWDTGAARDAFVTAVQASGWSADVGARIEASSFESVPLAVVRIGPVPGSAVLVPPTGAP